MNLMKGPDFGFNASHEIASMNIIYEYYNILLIINAGLYNPRARSPEKREGQKIDENKTYIRGDDIIDTMTI